MRTAIALLALVSLAALPSCAEEKAPAAPLRLVKTIPLEGVTGRFDHLALDESTDVLYVVALGNDTLEVVDLGRGERTRTIRDLPRPTGIAIDQRSGRFAVASSGDGRCHIWGRDLADPIVVEGFDDADNLRYEAETERYFVGYGESLGIFSAVDGRTLGAVPLGGHPESFQLEPGTGRVFVNVPDRRAIVVVDAKAMTVAAVWPVENVAANYPMALDAKQNLLFVGCRQPAKLLVLDSRDGSRLETLDCGGDADDLFIDENNGRVYVACGEGRIDVFAPFGKSSHTLLHSIETVSGARTALWDPKGRRLFLATPRRGDAVATIRVYEAP